MVSLTSWRGWLSMLMSDNTCLSQTRKTCEETDIAVKTNYTHMSRDMTKPTKWVCAQRRLRSAWASTQSDQSLRCALNGVAKDPRFLYADSEDSDQNGRMPRLIWVFAGRTLILLVLSCRGSYCPRRKGIMKNNKFWIGDLKSEKFNE